MADASIIISVQAQGADRVRRDLDGVTASGRQASGAADLLRRAFLALGGLALARQLMQISDGFTNMQNRIRLVTKDTEELNTVTQQLFQISNDTRSSFNSTAEVYSRTAQATKELGLSQQQTLDFTKSLNQAVILSGASAQEAEAALIQLSQGLASGALRGDELRSVLEQLPAVADVIAKGMGVTRGELRQLGQDGKISAEQVIEAFTKAREELNNNFATTVPTIGQAITVLMNKFTEFVGAFNQVTGLSASLSQAILYLANNIDVLGKYIGEAAITLGVAFGVVAINRAIVGLRALYAVMLANPFFALVAGVTAVVQAFGGWEVAILSVEAVLTASAAGWMKVFNAIGTRAEAFAAGIAAVFQRVKEIFAAFTLGMKNFINDPTASGNWMVLEDNLKIGIGGAYRKAFDAVKKEGENRADDINRALEDKLLEIGKKIDEAKNRSYTVTGNADLSQPTSNGVKNPAAQNLEEVTKQFRQADDAGQDLKGTLDEILENTDRFANAAGDAFADFVTGAKSGSEALKDLARQLISIASQSLFKGSSGGGGLGGLLGNVLGSVFSGGSLFGSQGMLNRIFTTGSASFVGPLPAFASGGSMVIGGNSGVDNNLLQLNNTPIAKVGRGETLDITPAGGERSGSGGVIINQTFNVSTGVQQTVRAELQRFLPVIEKQTTKAYEEAKMRGAVT